MMMYIDIKTFFPFSKIEIQKKVSALHKGKMSQRQSTLRLYKQMLRESSKFNTYNFKEFALRRTREDFRRNMHETDSGKISALIQKAQESLELIKRQATLSQMFPHPHFAVEDFEAKMHK
jgi:hypothetical protein